MIHCGDQFNVKSTAIGYVACTGVVPVIMKSVCLTLCKTHVQRKRKGIPLTTANFEEKIYVLLVLFKTLPIVDGIISDWIILQLYADLLV